MNPFGLDDISLGIIIGVVSGFWWGYKLREWTQKDGVHSRVNADLNSTAGPSKSE